MRKLLLFVFAVIAFIHASGQTTDLPTYNHYYVEPYFYNPAFMAAKEHAELNVIYRQQWTGVEGAPTFSQMSFIYPISKKLAVGLNAFNYKRGLLTTTSAMASLSYAIELGDDAFLSFGMSGGAGRSSINLDGITNTSDPALSRALDKSFFAEGQAGMSLQIRRLTVGVSLPQLFTQEALSSQSFQKLSFNAFNSTLSSIGYQFPIGASFSVQPMLLYRTWLQDGKNHGEFEGYGTLYYKDIIWVGGLYRPDYGASGYLGLRINKAFQLGYSYEFPTKQVAQLTNSTHEFRLGIKIGKQRISRHKERLITATKPVGEQDEIKEEPEAVPEKVESSLEPKKEVQAPPVPAVVEEKKPEPVVEKEIVTTPPVQHQVEEGVQVLPHHVNDNPNELKKGTYVVVGVFSEIENAQRFSTKLLYAGYTTSVGFNSSKQLHYVYIQGSSDLSEAKKQRDRLRKINRFQFQDTWILIVQ